METITSLDLLERTRAKTNPAQPTTFLRTNTGWDLAKLASEVSLARGILDFDKGPYRAGISLPTEDDVPNSYRNHRNNLPFSGALAECTYLREIFDSFNAEKVTFRLLRRAGKSAYAFHDDKDKGPEVFRFQIPIITNDRSFMVIPHPSMEFGFVDEEVRKANDRDICFDMAKLDRLAEGRFDLFVLEPGFLYWFDTNRIHTLINASDEERIVLSIDIIENSWFQQWFSENLVRSIAPSSVERSSSITWKWNSLRNGVIRND